MNKGFYHWCCEGIKNDVLFRNVEEFIAGMNRIAVCWLQCRADGRVVYIWAFCLLDNHFHFILYGTEEDTTFFMERYAMLSGQWISRHRGESLHGTIVLGHWRAYEGESLREKIIYNLRQATEAGLPFTPQGYPWCSAWLMFSDTTLLGSTCRRASEFSARKLQKITFSHVSIPDDWQILPNGMIWPGCYTCFAQAEKEFRGTGDFMFMLNNGQASKKVNAEMMTERPSIPDREVRDMALKIIRRLFRKEGIGACTAEERLETARRLRQELRCGHKQLARIVQMREEDLRALV